MKIILLFFTFAISCWVNAQCPPIADLTFRSQFDLQWFRLNYPNCSVVNGNLIIEGPEITDISLLSNLTTVEGSVIIKNNPLLESLQGLDNIRIATDVVIRSNPNLKNLSGLNNLRTVTGDLEIDSNEELANVYALASLTRVQRRLSITNNLRLSSLDGLVNLRALDELALRDNSVLPDLRGLSGLTSLSNLVIIHNEFLEDLTGLENLNSVERDVSIQFNNGLKTLKGLENLSSIGRSFGLSYNGILYNISNLTSLTSVGKLHDNGQMAIKYNPALSSCSIAAICTYLHEPLRQDFDITNNKIGCNTSAEIKERCTTLPVKLSSFTAQREAQTVALKWTTSEEINSDHFSVEHRKEAERDWHQIAKVNTTANRNEPGAYSYIHSSPSPGTNLYRLKMVDFDGTYTYSAIRNIDFEKLDAPIELFPNPVSRTLNVRVPTGGTIQKFEIYSSAGQLIISGEPTRSEIGEAIYRIDTSNLTAGSYILRTADQSGEQKSRKFVRF